MHKTILNIKIDPQVKNKAQKVAAELGLTLSGVLNAYLRQFIKTKEIHFSVRPEKPTAYLLEAVKEAGEQRKSRKTYSFNNPKKAIDFLKSNK